MKANPLKLNNLQLKTLVLTQILARRQPDEAWGKDGSITLHSIPQPHGDHVHIGEFTIAARDATGFSNRAVWTALARKGLVRSRDVPPIALTREGMEYETGLDHHFVKEPEQCGCCDDGNNCSG
ncbi:hypothetical protein [Cohaesibacter gelatinilyticus]|uniref:Uncharacterized protein n=1 Tax=Cohaesibacter gelatinilyticus TaxID=372072 RepID=A0A285NHT1_9HYPH|nr:hypothetical protein [Cohaesibacter gelatinilyticus]SNZ07221.1 hypothetical protein SAMN06265368_0737 [Cohaesibacter gelatinilyticus]